MAPDGTPSGTSKKKSKPAKSKTPKEPKEPKAPKLRTKVIVRRLPPHVPEDVFWNSVSPWVNEETADWKKFIPGKFRTSVNKENVSSRAYVHFKKPESVVEFHQGYDGHLLRDSKGHESVAVVEFAPFQKVPQERKKSDARKGTIDDDPDFIDFIENLNKPKEPVGDDKDVLEAQSLLGGLNTNPSVEPKKVSTPLLDHLRAAKSAAAESSALAAARQYQNPYSYRYPAQPGVPTSGRGGRGGSRSGRGGGGGGKATTSSTKNKVKEVAKAAASGPASSGEASSEKKKKKGHSTATTDRVAQNRHFTAALGAALGAPGKKGGKEGREKEKAKGKETDGRNATVQTSGKVPEETEKDGEVKKNRRNKGGKEARDPSSQESPLKTDKKDRGQPSRRQQSQQPAPARVPPTQKVVILQRDNATPTADASSLPSTKPADAKTPDVQTGEQGPARGGAARGGGRGRGRAGGGGHKGRGGLPKGAAEGAG